MRSGFPDWLFCILVLLELKNTFAIASCREARRTGNLKLVENLMARLSKSGVDEKSPVSLRIAREAAKQVYSSDDSNGALQKMITVSAREIDEKTDKAIPELIARYAFDLTSPIWSLQILNS